MFQDYKYPQDTLIGFGHMNFWKDRDPSFLIYFIQLFFIPSPTEIETKKFPLTLYKYNQ